MEDGAAKERRRAFVDMSSLLYKYICKFFFSLGFCHINVF